MAGGVIDLETAVEARWGKVITKTWRLARVQRSGKNLSGTEGGVGG